MNSQPTSMPYGLNLEDLELEVFLGMSEGHFSSLLRGRYEASKSDYRIQRTLVLGGLSANVVCVFKKRHFFSRSRLERIECLRAVPMADLRASFADLETRLTRFYGQPEHQTDTDEGFQYIVRRMGTNIIAHGVVDRFMPAEFVVWSRSER